MAAETALDPSTLDEWVLLHDVRAAVVQFCKAEETAEELIPDYVRQKVRRYRCWRSADEGGGHRGIDPRFWGIAQPEFGVYYSIDWINSSVTYFRLPPNSPYEPEAVVLERLGELLPEPFYRIRLVRLHRDDVIAMLRSFALLPPAPVQPAVATPEPPAAKFTPAKWFSSALKNIPRDRGEGTRDYAVRLHAAMKTANVKKMWTVDTFERRLHGDRKRGKTGRQKTGKNRQRR